MSKKEEEVRDMLNMELYFGNISEKRQAAKIRHSLIEIIAITIIAVIGDCDGWEEIEDFCIEYEEWFRKELGLVLEYGIPSSDTFARIWRRIDAKEFKKSFMQWAGSIRNKTAGEVISLDGKTVCGSGTEEEKPIHVVSAWVHDQGIVLGQITVPEKTNEITAVPELIKMLDISGCIITADAMSCQKKIVASIIKKQADYVIGLKGNQGELLEYAELYFSEAKKTPQFYKEIAVMESHDIGHGRIEHRTYQLSCDLSGYEHVKEWKGLKAIGVVYSRIVDIKTGKTTEYARYFITSLVEIAAFAKAVREHWGIEASLHHVLDVSFQEDDCTVHKDNGPDNLAVIRHFAINILAFLDVGKNNVSARRKRKMCARSPRLLLDAFSRLIYPNPS